ncbi:MAG: DMT family transporter [Spirochaetia bacterium]|nr:DMT family transporter [Spirochaetia bacterium]
MIGYKTGVALTLLSSSFFGLMGLFNMLAKEGGLGLYERITLRFLVAAIILWVALKLQGKSTALPRHLRWRLFISSSMFFGGTSYLLFLSYAYISTSLTTTLHFIYPLLVLIFAMGFDGYKPSALQKWGTLLSLAGLYLAVRPTGAGGANQSLGIALALASALTFSLYVRFLNRAEVKGLDNTLLMLHILTSAAFVWAIPTIIDLLRNPHLPIVWGKAVGGIAGLAILATVLGCSFFSLGIRAIGSEKASILSVFEPVTAILAGVVLLGESLPTTFALGSILIILGSYLVSRNRKVPISIARLQEKKDLIV